MYLIWSHEHRAWWRPDRQGYTPHLGEAGSYSREEAADITLDHVPPGEEVAVRAQIAQRVEEWLRQPTIEDLTAIRSRLRRAIVQIDREIAAGPLRVQS